jgi:hypothetical protein
MNADYNIYMDCCSLNRPYDDQLQDKIRMESSAIIGILFKCFYGDWRLLGSDVIHYEILKTPDEIKRGNVFNLYSVNKEIIELNPEIQARAVEIQGKYKLKSLDSLHFASAEYRGVDVLLTTDKSFLYNAKQIGTIRIENPVKWFMEVMDNA